MKTFGLKETMLIYQDLNVDKEEQIAVFSQIYSCLCHKLGQPTEYRISMLIMPSMNILLQRQVYDPDNDTGMRKLIAYTATNYISMAH